MTTSAMTVLLVHGMGRTQRSMRPLARVVVRRGAAVQYFAYSTARESVTNIVERLCHHLTLVARDEYIVVGHSLGGLLLRVAIADLPVPVRRPARLIMMGTPSHSPRLARRFAQAWWYRHLNGDAGDLLACEPRMAGIPAPSVPCTLIAGTLGLTGRWSPFGGERNDGLVALSEARLDAGEEWITVPATHPFMMHNVRVQQLVAERCAPGLSAH